MGTVHVEQAMKRAFAGLLGLFAAAGLTTVASAQDRPALALADQQKPAKSWDQTLLCTRGVLGLGTPVGLAGVTAELGFARWVAMQVGIGSNGEGMQFEAMAYGRLPLGAALALEAGAGLSLGPYVHHTNWLDADHSDDSRWDGAVFANGELSLEILAPGGFSARASAGIGRLLNPDAVSRCTDGGDIVPCGDARRRAHTVPYLGMGFGYAFSL
jgi:hypothetical protein